MVEAVRLVAPSQIEKNEENPRLIFRSDELAALEKSIREQGILVPLTVYQDRTKFVILDGERRWRCATKLGLARVPVIVQPKPDRLQNIMMMFAIHKARADWDPLPTALKLDQLRTVLQGKYGRLPTESELAAAASMDRGEVRRNMRILSLPQTYQTELMGELEKPRALQTLTVDNVLESVRGAESLRKRKIITGREEKKLSDALVDKFRRKVLTSTVEPRLLPRMGRAVQRGDITLQAARTVVQRLVDEPDYTVEKAYERVVEVADFNHAIEVQADRLMTRLEELAERRIELGDGMRNVLLRLRRRITTILRDA